MAKRLNIAIDGPSGAGKSTISRLVSERLGILYLDTGAMYRAMGLKLLRMGVDPTDADGVTAVLDVTDVDVKYRDGLQRVYLDGEDVTGLIRQNEVSKAASDCSAIPSVRLKMVELQRVIADGNDCVLDGRDIGTFVLPDATLKIYLTADAEERAHRRCEELKAKGQAVEYGKVLEQIIERDRNDSSRAFAPLKRAYDAVEIDSTHMTPSEVVKYVVMLAEKHYVKE